MAKTDWTAEEVRATVKKIKGHAMTMEERADMFDIATTFAECIAAVESSVPVAQYLDKNGWHDCSVESVEIARANRPDQETRILFTYPPAQPAQEQPGWKVPDGWADAYAAFKGAFDTPAAWLKDSSEYANDARKRLCEFNEAMLAASPTPPKEK